MNARQSLGHAIGFTYKEDWERSLKLMEQFHLTQDEVARRTGKDRATVANSVRLLSLEEPLLEWIEEGKISAGHGRALLAIEDRKQRQDLAQKASRGKLTVRQLERMATRRSRSQGQSTTVETHDPNREAALDELQKHIFPATFARVLNAVPRSHCRPDCKNREEGEAGRQKKTMHEPLECN